MAMRPTFLPLFILLLFVVGISLPSLIANAQPLLYVSLVGHFALIVVYSGYPLLVGTALEHVVHRSRGRGSVLAVVSFCWVLVAEAFVLALVLSNAIVGDASFAVLVIGGLALVYLIWFGASRLVSAEQRAAARFDQYFGALLLFFWLPIGYLFLQRRLNQLLANPKLKGQLSGPVFDVPSENRTR